MHRIRCVIFDVDGTLTQTNRLIFASFNYITEKYLHRTYTEPEIIALFGPPEEDIIEEIIGKEHAAEASDDYYRFYADRHDSLASMFPHVVDVLEYLKRSGMILAVFTGKGERTTRITLEKFGVLRYFDMIVTGSDVVNRKPASEGILNVMSKYSLAPDEVLMIGDGVPDIRAARDAGVRIASVVWDSYAKSEVIALKPDIVFHSVEQLLPWMKSVLPA